jgi:hypothetical protein
LRVAVVIAGAALLDLRTNHAVPSSEHCADQCNRSTNARNRALAARQHFEIAVIAGWLAKDRFPGCGVLLRHGDGQPWLSFSSQLHAGWIDQWGIMSGDHWGFDSPEGGPDAPNALVSADGRVRLIET